MIRDYEVVIMNEVENKIIKTNKGYDKHTRIFKQM